MIARRIRTIGGADPPVRSRPPGRLVEAGSHLIHREKSIRSGRADRGVRPTIPAGFDDPAKSYGISPQPRQQLPIYLVLHRPPVHGQAAGGFLVALRLAIDQGDVAAQQGVGR